jgi:indole-3-glycerol phosphate synthase
MLVCESGIGSAKDVERMAKAGAKSFLVGESLMRAPDVAAAVRALVGDFKAKPAPLQAH